ncbi:MAG: sulfurtransferase TusA family protein [Tannerellaceae bacterium]|nr:sulfurtransferase TusA family protein [Tannerellaceae bacterium]
MIHGNITASIVGQLAAYAAHFGEDIIRFTTRQHIQFRNIPGAWLPGWYELFTRLGFQVNYPLLTNDIISCTGADTCRLGICFSKGASKAIRNKLIESGLPLEQFGPARINISGCSNSCAQQVWADLGFAGKVSRNERMYPAYTVYAKVNGPATLGESLGTVSACDLPEFCTQLFHDYLAQQKTYLSFSNYIEKADKEKITQLLAGYKEIPSFDEDKNYYYDWGSNTPFSVTERGKAECSAGLFDMIDIDGGMIEQSIQALEKTTDPVQVNRLLYDITFSASRMLLITRGAEPRTTAESFTFFIHLFINAGLIDKAFLSLIEAAAAKEELAGRRDEVLKLAQAVQALYQTMDDSLQFKGDTPVQSSTVTPTPTIGTTEKVIKDFRGVGCPLNFIKTKLVLAPLPTGALLEVWLDDGPPADNVPGSVRNEGHTIVSMEKQDNHWQLTIQKK